MAIRLKPIREQVVVVVGASSGIGREAALRFAKRGARVVLAGRSQQALDELAGFITAKGDQAVGVAVDVADYGQVQRLAERAAEIYGAIDTWVHAAAVSLYAPFETSQPGELEQVIRVNLLGQMYGAKAALPHLRKSGGGALIHISSVEARRAMPYHSAYAASKHGIAGFLDAMRLELEKDDAGISVTNMMPASINTPFFAKSLTKLGVKPKPIPPVYKPELVAEAILYAAERPVRDVYVGSAAKIFAALQGLSPHLVDKLLLSFGFKAQKTKHPKAADAPTNLYQHLPGYNRVHGEFSRGALPADAYPFVQTHPKLRYAILAGLAATAAWFGIRAVKGD